jgi:hypothetical protein
MAALPNSGLPQPANATRSQPASKYGTLPSEQIRNEPSPLGGGFERMAHRRYQKPTPKKRGNQWTILVREDGVEDGQRIRVTAQVAIT